MSEVKNKILELAKRHGLNLMEDSFVYNESGLDFQVVFAKSRKGNDWVLRIPRRADVFPRTNAEKRALDLVNKHVAFEVPTWEIYTEELIAYKKLQGIPLGTIDTEA